jgi:hypothetical protein
MSANEVIFGIFFSEEFITIIFLDELTIDSFSDIGGLWGLIHFFIFYILRYLHSLYFAGDVPLLFTQLSRVSGILSY